MNKRKESIKKTATRVICLVTAGILVLTTLIAALLSQMW